MKMLIALVLAATLLSPALAFAGASTDAALGLGAFAVLNQILGGTGIFQRHAEVTVVQPPVQERVIVREYVPAPSYYYVPAPVHYAPAPVVVYETVGWCPPGLAKHGRCHVKKHHHHW